MDIWEISTIIVVFYVGSLTGFFVRKWVIGRRNYDGIVIVEKQDDKILYSLELNDVPETIEFKDELIFKVKSSE